MAILFGVLSVFCGILSLSHGNPPVIPFFGLAFGLAGQMRENNGGKRSGIIKLCIVGLAISAIGVFIDPF